MGRLWSAYGAEESFVQSLEGNPAQTTPLGGPRLRSDDNIQLDLK
jgi:hypothetical protein